MNSAIVWLRGLPLPARWAVVGALSLGVVGAVAGLVVGLLVYAPTSPFAAVELGLPAGIVGGLGGLAVGVVVAGTRGIPRGGEG